MNVGFFAAFAWFDGARAADARRSGTGSITFFPGSSLVYTPGVDGFSMLFTIGWLPLAVGAVAFALAARPWRLLSRNADVPVHTST